MLGNTNYYQALVNLDNILQGYQKEENRDLVVLFITDGLPDKDTPNQIAEYNYLKSEYPYLTIQAIQYEMGSGVLDPIKEVSDTQTIATTETLSSVIDNFCMTSTYYDNFQIIDYIDNDYFDLDNIHDVNSSIGEVKIDEENGLQKVIWTIPNLRSGGHAKLTIDIKLKEEYHDVPGTYSTNVQEQVISSINDIDENVTSMAVPRISNTYEVIYEGNAPEGCNVENVPDAETYFVFDTVSISEEEANCSGYQFKGWEVVTDNVTKVNKNYFIMPESDVVIRAKWSKLTISKSMDGVVSQQGDPIMNTVWGNWWPSTLDKTMVTSITTKDNTDIPDNVIEWWDASAAQDQSVIAYIEDDGNGGYKVTIGGRGGIIADWSCNHLFMNFSNMQTIDLTYLDTSRVTRMEQMFRGCSNLTSLDLSMFNTSKVTSMNMMFYSCSSLINLNLSSFDTSNVTDMSWMIRSCANLSELNLDDFDTSKVTNMQYMFDNCRNLENLNLNSFNTSNVRDMSNMFSACYNLTSLDVSGFDTSNVVNMQWMFNNCSKLTSLDVSTWNTSNVTNMYSTFASCINLENITFGDNWDTSNVTTMRNMFNACRNLKTLDLSMFTTPKVESVANMFSMCDSLTNLDIRNMDFTMTEYTGMFSVNGDAITILVKDIEAKDFIEERLNEVNRLYNSVTIV